MAQVPARRSNPSTSLSPRRSQHPLELFRRQFDSMFDRFFGGGWPSLEEDFGDMRVWDFNIQEKDNEVLVRADLPGFDEKEINVELNNDVLTIRAEKEQKEEGREEYRSFHRSVMLPAGVNAENAQANYRNGVLELRLPRSEESRAKRIPIQGQQPTGKIAGPTGKAAHQQESTAGKK